MIEKKGDKEFQDPVARQTYLEDIVASRCKIYRKGTCNKDKYIRGTFNFSFKKILCLFYKEINQYMLYTFINVYYLITPITD